MKHRYVFGHTFFCSVIVLGVLLLSFAVPLGHGAYAQEQTSLANRLDRLERDIRTLNLQIAGRGGSSVVSTSSITGPSSGTPSGPGAAQMTVRMDAFEEDLRSVTGSIEQLTFQITTMTRRLDKLVADIDFRLTSLERGGAQTSGLPSNPGGENTGIDQSGQAYTSSQGGIQAVTTTGQDVGTNVISGTIASNQNNTDSNGFAKPAGTLGTVSQSDLDATAVQSQQNTGQDNTDQTATVQTTQTNQPDQTVASVDQVLPEGTPRERYKFAFGLLRQAKYEDAEIAFKEFIANHNDDELAANARYWLGETYYVRGEYIEAAGTFLEGYQSDPQGPKAPDTLVKLGMSLANLNKQTEACAAFGKVTADYPKASTGIRNTVKRERARIGCE